MKQPKKLSYLQKREVAKAGLDPKDWMATSEDKHAIMIIHKETKEQRIVWRGTGESESFNK